jgi:hypothetical protein
MPNVADIEKAVSELSPEELRTFANWFEEYLAEQWDRQIEEDARAGRLDHLIEQARNEHESGNTEPLS